MLKITSVVLSSGVALTAVVISAQSPSVSSPAAEWAVHAQNQYQITPNVTYLTASGQDLKLDVYPPKSTGIPHAEIQYHFFWLSENEDGWFNAGLGQIRRDPTGSAGNFVGTEIDFTMKYLLVDPFAVLWFGYAHFFPGEYVEDTGEDPDRDFIFAQLAVTF